MELLQLKYFCEAAKQQNFSKTAEKFNVPASNISQTVNRLEKELGIKLFVRKANKVILNERGMLFLNDVQNALQLLENAKKRLIDSTAELEGEIKILINANRRIVTAVIEEFKKENPKVNFFIKHNEEENFEKFDIIISDICADKNAEKFLLVREKMGIAANVKNNISSICDQRFITMQKGSSSYRLTELFGIKNGFKPNIAIQTDDPFYVRKFIELGLGIAIVPTVSWKGLLSENIVCREIDDFERLTYVWISEERYLSRAAKEFLKKLIK